MNETAFQTQLNEQRERALRAWFQAINERLGGMPLNCARVTMKFYYDDGTVGTIEAVPAPK